jgi:hypothetical protein
MEGKTDILFERWFYCDDLGVQVAIKIRCYFFNDLVPTYRSKDYLTVLIHNGARNASKSCK